MRLEFHCGEKDAFKKDDPVRTVLYSNYSIGFHSHDFYELNIVLSGKGMHCIGEHKFSVGGGDVFVIPPQVAHAYVETESLEVFHLLLQKDFLENNREESRSVRGFVQLTEIEPFLRNNFDKTFFLHLSYNQLQCIKNDFSLLDDEKLRIKEVSVPLRKHIAWKILYQFSALLDAQLNRGAYLSNRKYERQIIRVLEYIHNSYNEKITIQTMCKKAYLLRSTFLRNFKEMCGITPIEYLNRYRCKMAVSQISEGKLSKTEIAYNCGFYDLSHMNHALKKYADVNLF